MSLTDKFEAALDAQIAAEYDSIEERHCLNDTYSGIEYTFTGDFVPLVDIVSIVSEADGYGIAEMSHITDSIEPCVKIFVAELDEEYHDDLVGYEP